MTLLNSSITPPPEWEEENYLCNNSDVRLAIEQGHIKTGYEHYCHYGIFENRPGAFSFQEGELPSHSTRTCFDPWNNFEISAKGEARPCCISSGLGEFETIEQKRNSDEFRTLRKSLLTGNLQPMCQSCHIRSMTTVDVMNTAIQSLLPLNSTDLLAQGQLLNLRIDINEKCNLKCTYCAVSQPNYQGTEMSETILTKILTSLPDKVRDLTVNLNGHGETTFHPSWMKFVRKVQQIGASTTILSNFAKPFDKDEIEVFAQIDVIQISLDTLDESLLKNIRRKVSLGVILRNIHKIRIQAFKLGLEPQWSISCGLYDKNISGLKDLAIFAIREKFQSITFWNLIEYPHTKEDNLLSTALSLSSLSEQKRKKAMIEINQVVKLLKDNQVIIEMPDILY